MEQNQTAGIAKPTNPDSKELRKALSQASLQANKMAVAFGLKVPSAEAEKTKSK